MPCNLNQRELAKDVKRGIRESGATPVEFNTVAISDGVSMGSEGMRASLVSREVIADSIELVARGHLFDGLVCIVGCDKTIPAAALALARLNIPGLVFYNSSIAPGRFRGRDVTIQDVFEAVGAHAAGNDDGGRRPRARGRRLSRCGRVRRAVHGEHDGDPARVSRAESCGGERNPCQIRAPVQYGRAVRVLRALPAALAMADEGGLEALSMRKLAQELGVEAMSLYNHVANKDDIVDGIVGSEIEPPADVDDRKTALRRRSISAHEAHARHPWAAGVWMTPRKPSPPRLQYADAILRTLREAGFSEHLTYHGYPSVVVHVLGYTLQEQNVREIRDNLEELAETFLRTFPADDYPDLAEHIRQHMEPGDDHQGALEFGLDLILDGLERLRDAERAGAGSRAEPTERRLATDGLALRSSRDRP